MDTPFQTSRRLRIALFLGMILLVQCGFAYLITWFDPPRVPLFVPIRLADLGSTASPARSSLPFANTMTVEPHRHGIQKALENLSRQGRNESVIVYLSGLAVQRDDGSVCVLPARALPSDASTWLPLRDVLEKLRECPARHKLLVLELTPPPTMLYAGCLHQDFAAVLPRELDAVPDADRLVLTSCAGGQQAYHSRELGQSVFAHYFHEALRGHADGASGLRDGHLSVREVFEFVQARVDRWAVHNRGQRQTPTLHGSGADFTLASVERGSVPPAPPAAAEASYAQALTVAWHLRDFQYRSDQFQRTPRAFQHRQARLLLREQGQRDDVPAFAESLLFTAPRGGQENLDNEARAFPFPESARKTLDDLWRTLERDLTNARPTEAERFRKRFIEEATAKLTATERDALVFAHAVADPRLDPTTLRLCDQLLHPTLQTVPRTPETLRLRLLADLAMRVEANAWPRELIESVLRATEHGEKALRQSPHLPGFVGLLDEPARLRHEGEVRLWARGYASLDDARKRLAQAADQFERLRRLNEAWGQCELALNQALCELPWYLDALEVLPELRDPWHQATAAARHLADSLQEAPDAGLPWASRLERLTRQVESAEAQRRALEQHRLALRAPFARDALIRFDRQCRSTHADATTRNVAEALLSVAAPVLTAEDRALLWQATQALSRRLNDETLALDRQDNEAQRPVLIVESKTLPREEEPRRAEMRARAQLTLLELAGLGDEKLQPARQSLQRAQKNPASSVGWCELGGLVRDLWHRQMEAQWHAEETWRGRERVAWLMPPLADFGAAEGAAASPTIVHRRRELEDLDQLRNVHLRHLARDYHGLNLNSPGIAAARSFYANAARRAESDSPVRVQMVGAVDALTEKQPYSHLTLEVTRQVAPGAAGPVELRFQRADEVWYDISPESVSLPALLESKESRVVTHKVPVKVTRKPKAERSGVPPPVGFLMEASCEGRAYHHLVTVPIIPSTQELQILVSADPEEPGTTLHEIHIRPGKVKQPHYFYVKNLTNRVQKVHVEIKAGDALVHQSPRTLTLEADAVRKVPLEETARPMELRGPLQVRVLDAERQKVLAERSVRVEILSPRDYVKVGEARFEQAETGGNRWTVQVEAARRVPGPSIAAQLVLPVQRIPGLLGIGGGTLQVEVPSQTKSARLLFAENLRLVHSVEQEGPVYLHIDGVPRAFIYRTTFARNGEPTLPHPDERPAVRLLAPQCVMAGINCLVDVEVDNAPPACKLEVALGRAFQDGSFTAEVTREFIEAKKRRIALETARDALLFDAAIGDWTATFETRSIVGAREFRARLIDPFGREIASSQQSVVIDDTPPTARLFPPPAQIKRGSVLQVSAEGADPESGISQVQFFLGKPEKGEIPPGAPRYKAIPAGLSRTVWQAALQIPADQTGPLTLGVQVVNHAGLVSTDSVALDVTDKEPGKTGLGEIRGIVLEGPRVQPNVLVTLFDEGGKEVARARTRADGTYSFAKLAPGRYRVVCVKPESQRRAVMGLIVEPDKSSKADLALSL